LKIKLKYHNFDTTEAESQVLLNILTENDFQDASENWQKRWEQCICMEEDYIKADNGH
jgi:hypothetical protein